LLAMNFGAFIAMLTPFLVQCAKQPADVAVTPRGPVSWLLTLYAVGAFAWGLRDAVAACRLRRPQLATWQRQRFQITRSLSTQRVLVTGATGFIGRIVARYLIERGHRVVVLCRDRANGIDLFGPHAQVITSLDMLGSAERIDAVINLAGEPIAAMRWSSERKAVLVESRVGTTRMLVAWMARLHRAPTVLITASAIGRYGTHANACLSESAAAGEDFPAALCSAWEREAHRAQTHGTRVVVLRLGVVLGSGGLLQRLLPLFRLGLGAPLGSGDQWLSWVHIQDVVGVVDRVLNDATIDGAVNVVAPHAVSNREFSRALACACMRPLWPAIPAILLRWTLGEMSTLLLDGQHVVPTRLHALDYRFRFSTLSAALGDLAGPARGHGSQPTGVTHA
jgi:uncharacterized protein